MKITKTLRVFLILLSVMMVLPLFACGDTPEETTTKAPEQTTAPKEETTTDKKVETTAPKADATTAEPEAPATTVAPEETTEAETTSAETTEATTESGSETTETGSESSETETTEVETTETTAAPECEHVEEEIPAVAPTCTETGLTEGKKCSLCGEILVAQQTVDALGHTEETVASKAATCTETGLTEGKKCSVCDEILVAQQTVDALGHTEEVVPGKAATCTEDGLTEGKKCSVCNTELVAQQTIPAGHTEETVAGKAATCTETGLTDGKKCSVCGEILVAQNEIPATNHANKTDKAFMAPTTAEAGWEAHTICPDCGKVWDAKGEELEAVPTIEKIVPTTEKYWGAYELSQRQVSSSVGSTFKPAAMSADRTYVRFERDGTESRDGAIYLVDDEDSTYVTGQFLAYKYRTDHVIQAELFATTEGGINGLAHIYPSHQADEKWHVVVINLADQLSSFVIPEEDGTYILTWSRIDIFDAAATEGYFDIAWMVTCDDPSEIADIMQEGDLELCPHVQAVDPDYTNNGDNHSTECAVCGETMVLNHVISDTPTWDAETMKYSGTCICGKILEQDMLLISEPAADPGQVNSFTIEQMDGYVRYTKSGTADPFIHIYLGGNTVTGQYAVVKYRVSKAGMTYNNSFVGSVMGQHASAVGGCDGNSGTARSGRFIYTADNEWHYLVIELKSTCFAPNKDGTYSCRFLRLGFGTDTSVAGDYIEIDEIAFASELVAAENYAYANDSLPPYTFCIDNGSNTGINGAVASLNFTTKWGVSVVGVVDMEGAGDINATKGVAVGGWFVTPGGTASYKYRIVTKDGTAVEAPALIDGWTSNTVGTADHGITKQGTALGWTVACGNGSAWQSQKWLDLKGYEGSVVDIEIVAVTNYGAEIAFLKLINVSVAEAQ